MAEDTNRPLETGGAPSAQAILDALACGGRCDCQAAVRKGRGGVHCPAHDDPSPSLSVEEKDGKVLVHCHAGCEQATVIEALRERGLWPSAPRARRNGAGREVRHELRDENGAPVAVHVRRVGRDGKKIAGPWWEGGLAGRRVETLPLYGVEHLRDLPDGAQIVVTEGEPACDALRALGVASVATVCGAAVTPDADVLRPLARLRVYLWPDRDGTGRAHMERIAARLHALGAQPRIIGWPDAPPAGDAADFVAQGGTVEDVRALLDAAEPWEPGANDEAGDCAEPVGGLVTVRLSEVEREAVEWRWRGRLPAGKLTIIEGDPDAGKSYVSLAIATAVTTGAALPGDTENHPPADVLILTAEDGIADTVRPRAEDMGAELSRIEIVQAVREADGVDRHLTLDRDLLHLEDKLARGGFGLVIIDPLNAYVGGAIDTHRDAAIRSLLTPLAQLAERCRVAIIVIMHLTKSARDRAIYRGQGSIAYIAAARVALLVGKHPTNEGERVVMCIKNNLELYPPALAFELEDGRFVWKGESALTADALLAPEKGDEERSALDDAKGFLRELLAAGPVAAEEVRREANSAGVAEPTLKRAKAALGVQARRRQDGFGGAKGYWEWVLPPQEDHDAQGGHLIPLCNGDSESASPTGNVDLLVQSCVHRPVREIGALWAMGAATWGEDSKACACCASPVRSEVHNDADDHCRVCRDERPAPERGGHLVRFALDLGAEPVAEAEPRR